MNDSAQQRTISQTGDILPPGSRATAADVSLVTVADRGAHQAVRAGVADAAGQRDPLQSLPWARIAHELGALKAVRYQVVGQGIVQHTKIAGALAALLKKLGIPIPKRPLAVTEVTKTLVSA